MLHAEQMLQMNLPSQARICGCPPPLPDTVEQLVARIRGQLRQAKKQQLLTNTLESLTKQLVRVDKPIKRDLYERERLKQEEHPPRSVAAIFGGEKNFKRDLALPHFERDDGAWFDFTITLFQGQRGLELISYDFEIRFPSGRPVAFLRFDLNGPANPRKDGMRSHAHPGLDDDECSIPAPVLGPEEMLRFLIHGLRWPAKPRHPKGSPADLTHHRAAVMCEAVVAILAHRGLPAGGDTAKRLLTCMLALPQGTAPSDAFSSLIQRALVATSAEDLLVAG